MEADVQFVPVAGLHGLLAGFEAVGLDMAQICTAMGPDPLPMEPGASVAVVFFERAWAEAARQYGRDGIATAVAVAIPFGAFGMIDYLCGSAATVAGGFASLELHYRLVATDNRIEIESFDGGKRVVVRPLVATPDYVSEFTIAVLASRFRRLSADAFRPARVLLTGPLSKANDREALLGCPVRSGQPVAALEIDRSAWQLPIVTADPFLHDMLSRLARGSASGGASSIESAIRARLRDALGAGRVDSARVGRLLGLSGRTLQRRLAEQGKTFSSVLDDFRREEAARLLTDHSHPLIEVAGRLGYSEHASFTRAFRRWFGVAPAAWREHIQSG